MSTPSQFTTLAQEAQAAVQGTLRVFIGRRDAADYFLDSQSGIVGSFIALLIGVGLSLSMEGGGLSGLILLSFLYAGQMGAAFIVLRQVGKGHRFGIFLTASNWSSGLFTAVTAVLEAIGFLSDPVAVIEGGAGMPDVPVPGLMVLIWIVTLVLQVNLGRIVAELRIMHVIMLLIAQAVGVMLAIFVMGLSLG